MRAILIFMVGTIAAVVILGLAVNCFSQRTPMESKSMIQKIVENPEKYDNKIVSVEGEYKEPQRLVDQKEYSISLQPHLSENWPLIAEHYYEVIGEVYYSAHSDILQINIDNVKEIRKGNLS